MTRRKRTTLIVSLTVAALLIAVGVAYAAGAFPDVDPSDVHAADIQWAADNGVVNGYTNGNFGPYDNITRGQAASMFKNYDDFANQGAADGTAGCKECHNDTTLITGKQATWAESNHGENESFVRATSAGCAGCHSGGAFSKMIAAGQNPSTVSAGDPDPTRQGCRACHQIHETGTGADWALETTAAVALFAAPGETFDGGKGNLCANCHQPRRTFPAPNADGIITGISTHWGPHHGPQSATLLGTAGAAADGGTLDGSPMFHYTGVADTCVGCHTPAVRSHLFGADLSVCKTCHPGAENFDINGVQTETQTRLDALAKLLAAEGLLELEDPAATSNIDGHPAVTEAPENQAVALYNWLYIAHEDKSKGVHNPAYTKAMLDAAFEALGQ